MTGGRDEVSNEDALEAFYAALLDDDPQKLYERAPCGYLSTTSDGTIVKVNQTFLTWTGYERRDLVGRRTFSALLTAGGRIYHETHYAPMLRMQGAARAIALDIVGSDGRRLPALVNSVVESDAEGRAIVVRTAIFDATERRAYERELVAAKERAEASEHRATLLARTLQQTLIPPAPPVIPGLDISAAYRPAGSGEEVGGDFYDVFEVAHGDWVIALGDVRGKGVDAAVVTASARYAIRAAAVQHPEPSRVLDTLNRALLLEGGDRFCTVVLARLCRDDAGWVVTTACGGHPLPIASTRSGGTTTVGRPGTLLGLFDDAAAHDTAVPLGAGDGLLLYTDGVTEARDRQDRFFGDDRLLECVRLYRHEPDVSSAILTEVLEFQDGDPRDDIAIVSVRVP